MLAGELETKDVIHDVSIVGSSGDRYPWVLQMNLSFYGMKELAECVDPKCVAPQDGSAHTVSLELANGVQNHECFYSSDHLQS